MVSNDYETPKDMLDMPKPGEHGNRKTATIVTTTGGGTFYNADCPYCGKSMPVGRDLSIMFSCCNNCNKSFDLRYPSTNKYLSELYGREIPFRLQDDEQCDEHAKDADDDSSKPFNPPPAKPKFPSAPYGSPYPLRGPENWPAHYDGRHN